MTPDSTSCLVCYLKPILKFGYIGVTPLRFSCPHSKPPTKVVFETSRFLIGLTLFLSLMMNFVIFDNLRLFVEVKMNYMKALMLVNECMLCLISYIFLVCDSLQSSVKARELQGLAEIIQCAAQRGIKVLSLKFVKISTWIVYITVLGVVVLELLSILNFIVRSNHDAEAWKTLIGDTSFLLGGSLCVHYVILVAVYIKVIKRVHLQIKLVLMNRLNKKYVIGAGADNKKATILSFFDTEKQLRELRRMHSSIFLNFLQTGKHLSPTALFWSIITTVIIASTNLFIIRCLQFGKECVDSYMLQAAKIYANLHTVLLLLLLIEYFGNMVSESYKI